MNKNSKQCLYCQVENDIDNEHCSHCGMALPTKHPNDKQTKINFFIKAFWAIVLFCVIMIFYLPR
ncbi:MAG: DnrP protein [Colwellia sp.]|nr:DnrP protein [Colwellia sp.]